MWRALLKVIVYIIIFLIIASIKAIQPPAKPKSGGCIRRDLVKAQGKNDCQNGSLKNISGLLLIKRYTYFFVESYVYFSVDPRKYAADIWGFAI